MRSSRPISKVRRADKPYRSRGLDGTKWVVIDKATYDACIDPADYR